MAKRKGMIAGNRKIQTGQKIDLSTPSYKWLLCRRCELNEVRVSIEAVACICSLCMTRACDHMPRVIEPKKKSLKVINTFEKNRAKEKKEASLAATFKKKKASLKDKPKPKKKSKLKKKSPKKKKGGKR